MLSGRSGDQGGAPAGVGATTDSPSKQSLDEFPDALDATDDDLPF